jgi:hypothetical protein
MSETPPNTSHRDVTLPATLNSTPLTCWLPASTVAPVDASVVFALVFSVRNAARVAKSPPRRSHFVPSSKLRLRSGGKLALLPPVAASVRPNAPSNDG